MKKNFLLCMICFVTLSAQTQNVGIGTSTPVQKLHVEGTTYLNGNVGIGSSTPAFPLSFGTAMSPRFVAHETERQIKIVSCATNQGRTFINKKILAA